MTFSVSGSVSTNPRVSSVDEFAQVEDDLLLDLGDRQTGDLDLAIEAQRDLAVGPDQPLARDRCVRGGLPGPRR